MESRIISAPLLHDAHQTIGEALEEKMVVAMVASCRVEYSGRTGSTLGLGDRFIIIKKDGCVLVHRSTDYRPVNWQPGGCIVKASLNSEGLLVIKAVRPGPLESLMISISSIRFLACMHLEDDAEFYLHASEEDMQKAIIFRPGIVEPGLEVVEFERRVEPGFVDIFGIDRSGNTVVIEIKKDPAGIAAVKQLAEYLKYIRPRPGRKLRPVIVAPALAKGTQTLISKMGFEFKQLSLQKCAEVLRSESLVEKRQARLKNWIQ